ncbi:hypothetical protein PHSY_001357 [Pseudozyma hubeiensis SY62]|uniref:Uncharacterized protein n=1 Tax=Pseudozyma hubeiensis (strain SY62) TaxID=1305764 RepID=R9NYQ8_PSEHS|nr:hypothetical protein PHSY_001357 [Pseudozyma hubeiensis SY62]GAC93792.1 hypothetical protein PHSY_001357 [Pseudozyma hubeiensis SY62]
MNGKPFGSRILSPDSRSEERQFSSRNEGTSRLLQGAACFTHSHRDCRLGTLVVGEAKTVTGNDGMTGHGGEIFRKTATILRLNKEQASLVCGRNFMSQNEYFGERVLSTLAVTVETAVALAFSAKVVESARHHESSFIPRMMRVSRCACALRSTPSRQMRSHGDVVRTLLVTLGERISPKTGTSCALLEHSHHTSLSR